MHDDVTPDGRTPLVREVAAKSRNVCCVYVQGEQENPDGGWEAKRLRIVREIS